MHSLARHMNMDFSRVSTRTMLWSRGLAGEGAKYLL